jgi:hypothetical protein
MRLDRAVSSAVERFVYTEDVGGSKPSLPTICQMGDAMRFRIDLKL